LLDGHEPDGAAAVAGLVPRDDGDGVGEARHRAAARRRRPEGAQVRAADRDAGEERREAASPLQAALRASSADNVAAQSATKPAQEASAARTVRRSVLR